MAFSITKSPGSFILPSSPTPSGLLPLSSMDRGFQTGMFIPSLYIFKHGINPATVIKQALARTLIHYHPIAGRFKKPDPDGELQVDCTGEGVWFVEGVADCSLDDVNWLQDQPLLIPEEQLNPSAPEPGLTLMFQFTSFKCGGFVLAILGDHTMADGMGVAQFTNAVAETVRGVSKLTVAPVWLRDTALPTPPKSPPGAPLSVLPPLHLKHLQVTITTSRIAQLKSQFTNETGKPYSTFDVLCAVVWKSRARAIATNPEAILHIGFSANARESASIPEGYYGNCIQFVTASARTDALVGESSVEALKLIREAKGKTREEFEKWKGGIVSDGAKMELSYDSLNVADWRRVGFEKVDFGWGVPEFVMPVMNVDFVPMCFFVGVRDGVRLMTRCVKEEHLGRFRKELEKVVQ